MGCADAGWALRGWPGAGVSGVRQNNRTGVTIALLDWAGAEAPTEQDIAGSPVLAWALSRVESISKTGGEVLGNRPLDADGIEPPDLTQALGEKSSVWGWQTIVNRAEAHFLNGG